MGWWNTTQAGGIDFSGTDNSQAVWGDGPADILDAAIRDIRAEFVSAFGRQPSKLELIRGVSFSLGMTLVALDDAVDVDSPEELCSLDLCDDPYHATYTDGDVSIRLCSYHFDMVAR